MNISNLEHEETPRLLLNSRDAAKALAISERKLWELTNRGAVRSVKIGRSVRYRIDDLQAFIDRICRL